MYNFKAPLIGIRGSGDLATGVAHRLFKAGFPVIMTELANPRMVRRSVSMGEAVWEGLVCVEGVTAKLLSQPLTQQELQGILERQYVGVVVDPEAKSFEQLRIKFEVDARMLKKELPDQRRPDHFIIGLGPGFVAGENIDCVVETMRGITLGQVITKGSPIANTGVPGVVGGESLRRLLKAPKSGLFKACAKLGDLVRAGDTVAYVDDEPEYDYVELCISIFNQTFKRDTFETDIKVITKLVTMFFKENHSFKYALCSFETNGYILSHFKNINDMNLATLEEDFPIIYINHEPLTIIIKPQAQNLFD